MDVAGAGAGSVACGGVAGGLSHCLSVVKFKCQQGPASAAECGPGAGP